MVPDLDRHVCWMCGRAVVLENCQTDERVLYRTLALDKESTRGSKIPPKPLLTG